MSREQDSITASVVGTAPLLTHVPALRTVATTGLAGI